MNKKLIQKIIESKEKIVLATILEVNGSSPRHSGSKMIINEKGIKYGTIGGGELEQFVLKKAKKILFSNSIEIFNFTMKGKNIYGKEMLCGGKTKIMIQTIDEKEKKNFMKIQKILFSGNIVKLTRNSKTGKLLLIKSISVKKYKTEKLIINNDKNLFYDIILPEKQLLLFGGGYINNEIYKIALSLDFEITIIDDRKEYANFIRFPKANKIIFNSFKNYLKEVCFNELTYIVIATKSHLNDIDALRQSLDKPKAYLGCIGSKNKIKAIKEGLIKEGYDPSLIKQIYAPIGLNIKAETPTEIAISILAEIIGVKNEKEKLFFKF